MLIALNNKNVKNFLKFISVLIFSSFIFINILTIKDGHNWGDDFSEYILHSKNIVEHKEYNSRIMLNPEVVYPPGFPFIIAPIIKIFGVNLKILKLVNVVFWYLSIALLYPVFLQRVGKGFAILGCLILSASAEFFVFKQNILSDIPFCFMVSASFNAFSAYIESKNKKGSLQKRINFFVLICVISAALLTRSAGAVLFVSAIFYLVIMCHDYKSALIIVFIFFVVVFLQISYTGVNSSAFSTIAVDPLIFVKGILNNSYIVIVGLLCLFFPDYSVPSSSFSWILISNTIVKIIYPLFYFILVGLFVRKAIRKSITFVGCFAFFYILLLIFWSGHGIYRFNRFVYPAYGAVLIICIEFSLKLIQRFSRFFKTKGNVNFVLSIFLILIFCVNVVNISRVFNFNDDVLLQPGNQEMFRWVKNNIKDDEHYLSDYERAVALMTGRIGLSLGGFFLSHDTIEFGDFIKRMKDLDVSYLILKKGFHSVLIEIFQTQTDTLTKIWENKDYQIVKIK